MQLNCEQCGRLLKARDEWVGRKVKCPSCGAQSLVSGVGNTAGRRQVRQGAKPEPASKGPRFSIGLERWMITLLVVGLVLVAIGAVINFGPLRARGQWLALEPSARDDVESVVRAAIVQYGLNHGIIDPEKPPRVDIHSTAFSYPFMRFTLPERVEFYGISSNGNFSGYFDLERSVVRAEVAVDGGALPSGVLIRAGQTRILIEGHVEPSGEVRVAELDPSTQPAMR